MPGSRGTKEKPLWRVGRKDPAPRGTVVLRGRAARQYAGHLAQLDHKKTAGQQNLTASTGAWRFRFHLVPGLWAAVIASGLAARSLHIHNWWIAAGVVTAISWVATGGSSRYARRWGLLFSVISAFWSVWLSASWLAKPWPALALASWLVMTFCWTGQYRWRLPGPAPEPPDTSVQDKFARLAAKRKWSARLGQGTAISGGMRYPVICDGAETHIGEVVSQPKAIAATYGSTVAQVYAEEHPAGLQDKGELFMLRKATLEDVVRWDGAGVSRQTGLARVGRWPDGQPVYEQVISLPRDGTKNCMVAGADGSGKSALLDLGIASSAVTGWIAPIILDPQMGQALPAWRDHVPYACGTAQCLLWLRALKAAMLGRSDYLASLTWIHPETGRRYKGMGFFNPFIQIVDPQTGTVRPLGLPVIEITIDEAPLLLAEKGAKELLLDLIKLGRKTGVRVRLAAQVPSLAELKAQEIRSLLIGGGAFCLRTGDKVSGVMMNITAAPWELPKKFLNGQRTHGLGYASTLDSRPNTPFRADWLEDPWQVAESTKIRKPDDQFAATMAETIAQADATADKLRQAADEMTGLQLRIMQLLPETKGGIILAFQGEHGMSEVNEALSQLADGGKVVRSGDLFEVAP